MARKLKTLWTSPTVTTWASFGARASGLLLMLPLLLKKLEAQELAVFLLINLLTGLRVYADFGFAPTFVRFISYALSGVPSFQAIAAGNVMSGTGTQNQNLLSDVVGTLRVLFLRMGAGLLVLFSVCGSFAIHTQIEALQNPVHGWIAWGIVVPSVAFTYWATQYSIFLQGLNQVALLRRWEAIFNLLATLTGFTILALGGRLLALVLGMQFWVILGGVRNIILARSQLQGWWAHSAPKRGTSEAFRAIWSPAWRTGLGAGMSLGLVQLSGVLYAQLSHGTKLATLLLSLRLMAMVTEFANAPYYSKLPRFSRLTSTGNLEALVPLSQRAMRLTYATFLFTWITLSELGPHMLVAIGSKVSFPPRELWLALGVAFILHRFGAMHIQLYNTTNNIIMHIADGVGGAFYITTFCLLIEPFDTLALPFAQICAYLGFYCWFAALHSYKLTNSSFFQFEKTTSIPALTAAIAYAAFRWPIIS